MYDDSSGSDLKSPASGSLQLTIVSLTISDVLVNIVRLRRLYGFSDDVPILNVLHDTIIYFILSVIIIILLVRRWWRRRQWHDEPAMVIAT